MEFKSDFGCMSNYWHLVANGVGFKGDSSQLGGGDFIIDSNRIVRMVFRDHDPTDRPPVITLIDVIRQVHLKNYDQ
ncbi:MAG: hypothetical protein M0C28_30545 [Candidatus Moduliflexus flocculans]|nr:hypothetical protein [Candidatus Moduliflexus flocculans]